MMKFAPLLNLTLGTALVLPAMTGQDEGGLLAAIESGELALQELARVQQGLEQADVAAIDELLRLTEPALPGLGAEADESLSILRSQVARLQMRLDQAASGEPAQAEAGDEAWNREGVQIEPGSTGLRIRSQAGAGTGPAGGSILGGLEGRPAGGGSRAATRTERSKHSFEGSPDFVADDLGHGRLLCKAGRYAEAFEVLDGLEGPEALYWSAVCLERVGREREAMERYQRVMDREDAGPFARSAANDLSFLQWKREYFERRVGRKRP